MARDYFDESKKKKKDEKKTVATSKPQSSVSSVSKKSTFLGGGASVQKAEERSSSTSTSSSGSSSSGASVSRVNERASRSTFMGGTETRPSSSTTNTRKAAQNAIDRSRRSTFMGGTERPELRTKQMTSADRQNQKSYGTTQPKLRTKEQAQQERTERRTLAQAQKSGDFDKASDLRDQMYGSSKRRTQVNQWDKDIADTITHTVKQGLAGDARVMNRSMQGITQKDAFLYTTQEQRNKADAKVAARDKRLAQTIENETQALEDIQNKHGYIGKQALSAVSSVTGMGMDIAVGAAAPGSSLAHMWMRSTGTSMGQVNRKAENLRRQLKATGQYTDRELDEMFSNVDALDMANAAASGGIEVLSELLFPGVGAARKVIGGKGMSLAERAGAKLFNKVGAKASGGFLKNLLKGTAEEVAEEEIGGPLQALSSNLIYGNKFQGYQEDSIKKSLTDQSNALRSQVHSEEEARATAARLSSQTFMDDSTKMYQESGYSKEESERLAELSREYLTASLSGDVDAMKQYQDEMVAIMAGGENSQKEKFTFQDAIDAAVSTSMMTLTTGLPGAISTMQVGNAYKENAGLNAVKQQAEMIRNWGEEKDKAKAQAIIDHIDNGGDLSGTQVYEIIQKSGELAEENREPERIKNQIASAEMGKRDLRISPISQDGVFAPQTQQRYEQIVNSTIARYDTLAKIGEDTGFDKTDVAIGANIGAAFETGVITSEMVNELATGSAAVKAVFEDVTGINLEQFDSYTEMNHALMAEAAQNMVNSARLEQAAWNDETRKQMSDYLRSDITGSKGDLAIQNALESVDPRDITQFLMMGDVARNLYDFARHTDASWFETQQRYGDMYPSLNTKVLKQVFEAAKKDKDIAETAGYGKAVKSGDKVAKSSLGQTAYVAGKYTDKRQNKEGATLTEESLLKNFVDAFGINIDVVDDMGSVVKDKDGNAVLDEDGNPVIRQDNGAFIPSTNTLIVNANADATRTITQTAVHELTHHIAVHAPAEYVKLQRYIMDAWYRQDAEGFTRAIKARQAAYKAQKNQDLSDEQALEEIIADGAADFNWGDADFIAEVTTKEPTLASRIIDAIKEVLRKLRNILASDDLIDERSREALYDKVVELDTVRSMWVKAAQVARKAQADQAIDDWQDKANKQNAPRLSVTEEQTESMETTISDADRKTLNNEGIEELDDGTTARYSVTSWGETNKDKKLKALVAAGHNKEAASKWIDDVNSIASIILDDPERLDYEADRTNKFLKPNGDYYKYTLDASTLCDKRRIYQGTYNAIQHIIPNAPLMQDDVVRIRTLLKNMDHKAPCGICYVESQRKNLGQYAKEWYDSYARKDEIKLADVTTSDGLKELKKTNPEVASDFEKAMAAKGVSSPKVVKLRTDYREDIMRMRPATIEYLNSIGGLRFHSFSDFETPHLIDTMQAVMDMATKNLMGMAYAKVPNFAAVFGPTGIKINLSLIAKTDENGNAVHDENGRLVFDSVEGIPFEEASKWRDAYPDNVAFILVGKDKEHTLEAINDDRVDFVIPFHRSKWSAEDMRRLGLVGYEDFATGHQENGVFVSEFWDYNKTGKENAERYLEVCKEKGVTPIFEQLLKENEDGTYSLKEDGSTDNYWKLLVEGKMYNHFTKKGAPQKPVQPNFNMDEARRVLNEYEGGANTLPVADDVVKAFIKEYKQNHPDVEIADAKMSISVEMDDAYMAAVNSGNMDEAQRLVDEAAKAAGYGAKAYHGTNSWKDFAVFDINKSGKNWNGLSQFGAGFYFTETEYGAQRWIKGNGSKNRVIGAYLSINNAIDPDKMYGGEIAKEYNRIRREFDPGLVTLFEERGIPFDKEEVEGGLFIEMVNELTGDRFYSTNFLKSLGYDGVIQSKTDRRDGQIVVFNPEQIKSADPVTYREDGSVIPLSERFDPTNNDIRYSLPTTDSDGNVLTDGQMEYFKNSQARDVFGRLVPVYHTTNKGGFTVFDPMRSDDHRSLFFAEDWDTSQTYGNYANSRFYYYDIDNIDDVKKYLDAYSSDRYFVTQEQFDQAGGWEADMLDFENVTNGEQSDFAKYLDNPDGYIAIIGVPDYSPDNTSYADTWVMAKSPDELVRELHNHFGWQRDNYRMGTQHGYYACYLNLEDPYIIDAHGDNWNEIHLDDYDDDVTFNTREIAEMAMDMDFDGVIIRNLVDHGGMSPYDGMFDYSDIYIAFSSNQVKDINNENPTENPDIRYSIPTEDEVKAYIAKNVEDLNDIPLNNPTLEQNRQNTVTAAENFEASIVSSWGRRNLNLAKETPLKNQLIGLMKQVRKDSGTDRQYRTETLDETIKSAEAMYKSAKEGNAQAFAREAWNAAERIVDDIDYNDDLYQQYKGIKDYFAHNKISPPTELLRDKEFDKFMADNAGKIMFVYKPSNVLEANEDELSTAYRVLSREYPGFFPKDIEHPVDQLMQMAAVLDNTDAYRDAYTSEEHSKLVEDIANNLCDIVSEGAEYRATINDLNIKAMKQRHEEALLKLKESRDAIAESERNRANMWKQRYNERIKNEQAKKKEKADKREHLKSFGHIEENYNKLCTWALKPTKEKNVPEEFRKALAEFLQALDLQTENSKKLEEKTGRVAQKTLRMRELKDRLKALADRKEGDGSSVWEVDESIAFLLEKLSDKLDENGNNIDALDTEDIQTIDVFMKLLIRNIERYKEVKMETRTATLAEIGGRAVEFFRNKIARDGQYGKRKGPRGTLETINATALTPAYLFDRMGPLKEMYDVLRYNGFDTYIRNEKAIMDRMTEILSGYYRTNKKGQLLPGSEAEKWRDDRSAQTIELANGKSVTMSTAQIMSLYCLAKRGEQALGHMMVGGIVVTPLQTGSKAQAVKEWVKGTKQAEASEKYVLAYEDVLNIISKLTEDQKNVADQLQKLMSVDMAKLGNEAHRELYGYEMFDEDDYFPIKVHGNERPTDINTIGEVVEKIKSFGFTKPLTPKAGQAIEIDDIFSVVADHCNGMNLYNAYLVPITDFMKVFNYTHTFEDGDSMTMKEAIEQAYGKDMLKYILNLMKDINGIKAENRGGLEGIMNKALGRAKRTAVFGNIRVALQQPTAIVRALTEIDFKYFKAALSLESAKGFIPEKETATMEELWKYCPVAQWKAWGYYDTYMGRDIEDVMMNKWTINDKLLAGYYGQLDNNTWSMIWQAVKAEQADKHPKMDHNSEEFLQMCGRRASEVFDKTQVVDSTFHRSDAMRNKQIAVKLFTAFMAEPTLTLNVFRAGLYNASEAKKSGNNKEANRILRRTIGTIFAQAVIVSAAQAFADAWRGKDPGLPWGDDDEDEEKVGYWQRWMHNFVYNLFDQMHLENNMYLIKDVTPYINYMVSQAADHWNWNPTLRAIMGWDQDYLYSQNNLVFAGLENTANGVAQLFKKLEKGDEYIDYNTKEPKKWYDIIQKIASGIGTFTGFPVGTIMRDIKPLIQKFLPAVYAADTGLMDEIANRMGYRKIGSSDSDDVGSETTSEGSSYTQTADDLPDNLTDEQKQEILKAGEKRAKKNEGKEAAPQQLDHDTLLYNAMKAAAGLEGEEYNKKVYSAVANGLKGYIADGDYTSIGIMRSVIEEAGGDTEYFDQRVLAETKTAYKKSIGYDQTVAQHNDMKAMYRYMMAHGVTQEQLSADILYESDMAKDMKVAYKIGDSDLIYEAMVPLLDAGITSTDLQRLYENRNKMKIEKYNGRFKDRLKSTGNFIWPTEGVITSHFGYRNAPTAGASSNHPAIDIGAPQGTSVVAADGGVVISAGANGGYGNSVGIKHDNGMITWYNHLYSWNVKEGDTVAQGQQIAQVGSTGISTGPHLDFKIMDVNGEPVDPEQYLQ